MATYRVIERRTLEVEADSEAQARQMVEDDEGLPVDALKSRTVEHVTEAGLDEVPEVTAAALGDELEDRVVVQPIMPRLY